MEQEYIVNKTFEKIDSGKAPLLKAEYECCRFLNCSFSESDLSGFQFTECEFSGCNLSLVKLNNTSLRDVKFNDCKMLGLHFDACSTFGLSFSFENCILNHSSFYGLDIRKTLFKNAALQEVDFALCDLTGAIFDQCDFKFAGFHNTILERADLRTSFNYLIDPELNRIKKAKISIYGTPGLLNKYDLTIDDKI